MLTRKGLVTAVAAPALLVAGALGLGIAALLLGVVLLLVLWTGRLSVRPGRLLVERRQEPRELDEDDAARVELRLTNRNRVPLLVEYEETAPATARIEAGVPADEIVIGGRQTQLLEYRLRLPLRGFHSLGPVALRFFDPFRNFALEERTETPVPVTVHPRRLYLDEFPVRSRVSTWQVGQHLVNAPGTGADFFSLRDYQHSDRIRDINWKASARRGGGLIVNQRTRESYAEIVAILDARAPMGYGAATTSPLAQACRVVPTLLRWVNRQRDAFHLMVLHDTLQEVQPGNVDRQTAETIALLTGLEASGTTPVATLLQSRLGSLGPGAPIIVLSSLEGDPSMVETLSDLRARHHPVTVIVPLPTFRPDATGNGPADASPEALAAMEGLRAHGVHVIPWRPDVPFALAVAEVAG